MNLDERSRIMIEAYGEAITFSKAGRLINRSPTSIKNMLDDGRLEPACEGTRVDVYSLARYICSPKELDFEAKARKRKPTCAFRV